MKVQQLNPHSCRTYLLEGQKGTAILVDPVLDHVQDYQGLLRSRELTLTHVIDTHTHADHISGCAALKDTTDCDFFMHEKAPARCVTRRLRDGDVLSLNGLAMRVLHTPGHTQDSVSLVIGDGTKGKEAQALLTGDCLFLDDAGGGRDDLPGGDPALHWESLKRLRALPGELVVYPAHEYRGRTSTSLARQLQTNPHLKPRAKEEFIRYLEDLRLGPAEWMKDVLKANYACARDPGAAWIPVDSPACEVKGTLDRSVNELPVRGLNAGALKRLLERGSEAPLLLDVREPQELESPPGALPSVTNIPIGMLAGKLDELEPYRKQPVVVVCRSGSRAYTAAQILSGAGFGDVQVLEGGMLAWRREAD